MRGRCAGRRDGCGGGRGYGCCGGRGYGGCGGGGGGEGGGSGVRDEVGGRGRRGARGSGRVVPKRETVASISTAEAALGRRASRAASFLKKTDLADIWEEWGVTYGKHGV